MKVYNKPKKSDWKDIIVRPYLEEKELAKGVESILEDVRIHGDSALRNYAKSFDNISLDELEVTEEEFQDAIKKVPTKLKNAIGLAYKNIERFHLSQLTQEEKVETMPGVICWRKSIAIERVGLYIPGGSAPLFSSVLMLGIPAKIAGCRDIVLCTPVRGQREVNPAILYTASILGITKVFKVGGAQAVAAMAFGTATIPRVDKIFGPGNQYVTKAKKLVGQRGVAIDMPAGPSEVLIVADRSCIPAFVAADLLSQAEHGPDSQVILVSPCAATVEKCMVELNDQIEALPKKNTAKSALTNSKAVVLKDMKTCLEFSNEYAPEHLIIASEKAQDFLMDIRNAGSVFLGNYSCESAGDYASGTNHTLPTNGLSRSYSGVSVDSFVKKVTFQNLSKKGLEGIGKAIEIMAEAEDLFAHKNAVTIRLEKIKNEGPK